MAQIAIGSLDACQAGDWFDLNEGTVQAPILGTLYDPKVCAGEVVQERLRIGMRGSAAAMRTVIQRLESLVCRVHRYAADGVGCAQYLRIQTDEDGFYRYSRILSASLEGLPEGLAFRESGSGGIDLVITRENHWDSAEMPLPLSNASGSLLTEGITVVNHHYPAGSLENFVEIDCSALGSDCPAPIRLEISNTFSGVANGDLWVGAFGLDSPGDFPNLQCEITSGASGTLISGADASADNYTQVSWSGSGWQDLTSVSLSSADLMDCAGRWFTPILRLQDYNTNPGLQLRLAVSAGGTAIYSGPAADLPIQQAYLLLPPLQLPLGRLPGRYPVSSYTVSVQGYTPDAAAHSLTLDYLSFLPMDALVCYQASGGAETGDLLSDDGFDGRLASMRSLQELRTYRRIGMPPVLMGVHACRLYFFWTSTNAKAYQDRTLQVKAWYRQRRKTL